MVVVALVVGGLGFFGGIRYTQAKRTAQVASARTGAGFAGRRGGSGGGFTGGQIISKDDKSITIKTNNGGSMIVFVSPSTQIAKSVSGALTDLATGQNVTVTGTTNSDSSLTAQMVQIRPAGTTPPGQPGQ